MGRNRKSRLRCVLVAMLLLVSGFGLSGCSIRRMAVNSLADALAAAGDVYASDEDPELIRDALPFALKTTETLLAGSPDHPGLLLSACSGFTQYAFGFVVGDAERIENEDYFAAEALRERARGLLLRGRDYCLRALELSYPGIGARLILEPAAAAAEIVDDDLELAYWTGASWGAAIAIGLDQLDLVADLPVVRALMDRALEIDESWNRGSIHEVLITLEALPEAMGGSRQRAREHFHRAVELAGGSRASTYVTLAVSVAVPEQNRAEFEALLRQALAIDLERSPSERLANTLAQSRARVFLRTADELFIDDPGSPTP